MCSSLRDKHKRSKRNTDSTDATDLFFHGFFFCCLGLYAPRRMDFHGFSFRLRQSSAVRRNKIRNESKTKKIREKIKSVASVLSVIHFERVLMSPKAHEQCIIIIHNDKTMRLQIQQALSGRQYRA